MPMPMALNITKCSCLCGVRISIAIAKLTELLIGHILGHMPRTFDSNIVSGAKYVR